MAGTIENLFWVVRRVAKKEVLRLTPSYRRVAGRKTRVERERTFEQPSRLGIAVLRALCDQCHAAMEQLPSAEVFRRCRFGSLIFGAAQFRLDLTGDFPSDLVLDGEDIVELAVEPFRPDVIAGTAVHELGRNPDAAG